MKVDPRASLQFDPLARAGPRAQPQRPSAESATPSDPAASVQLSPSAQFVADLRASATPAPFRPEVVSDAQTQISAGVLERNADMTRTVDSLLASL
jgi:hypothetical protein